MKMVYEKGPQLGSCTLHRSLVSVLVRFHSKLQGASNYYFSESKFFLRVRRDRQTANREVHLCSQIMKNEDFDVTLEPFACSWSARIALISVFPQSTSSERCFLFVKFLYPTTPSSRKTRSKKSGLWSAVGTQGTLTRC